MSQIPSNPSESTRRKNPHLYPAFPATVIVSGGRVDRERDLHDDIETYCRMRFYLVCHSRMDRPSTIAVGFPDFVIFMPGRNVCFLEAKKRGAKATTAQFAKLAHARKLGFVAEIVDNLADAIEAMRKAMNL
jgi:hypothetical protein